MDMSIDSNIQHMNINNSGYEFSGESSFTCVEVEIYQVIDKN